MKTIDPVPNPIQLYLLLHGHSYLRIAPELVGP